MISPYTDRQGVSTLGERIRATTAAEPVPVGDDRVISVTVSVGAASGHGDTDLLVREADAALYAAKAAGRNVVVTAGDN